MSASSWTEPKPAAPRRDPGSATPTAEPGPAQSREPLARLLRLVFLLQTERFPNAGNLAKLCGVSRRTIYRDLEVLEKAGVPVRFNSERQGYQVSRGFSSPPSALEESEVLALLALSQQWTEGASLGLARIARGGASKLAQTLPAESRERVFAAAEPFNGAPGSAVPSGEAAGEKRDVNDALLAALAQQKQLRLWYRESSAAAVECTKFSLYRLFLHDGRWLMVGRSSLHRRVLIVALDWVEKIVLTDDRSIVPPRFNLERFLGLAWRIERKPHRDHVALRFSPKAAPRVDGTTWHRTQKRVPLSDGGLDLHFVVEGVDEMLGWVLSYGDEVEVLEPPELRELVVKIARRVVERHAPHRPDS
jgi:predicted DNA-binding transcriptional regulator YafY